MTPVTIPNTIVEGNNVFPYSVDFQYGGDAPSELTLRFVQRDGAYRIPTNSSSKPVRIKVGNFREFSGYVVETEVTTDTGGGSVMTVNYRDESIILDRLLIGLRGLHGPGGGFGATGTGKFSPNMILVGRPIDPCQGAGKEPVDPCAPNCVETGNKKESFKCEEERILKILQVDYSFNDLVSALRSRIRFGNIPTAINADYRASYTGPVREVLRSWCADFGLSFYWEGSAIHFYDLSQGVAIKDSGVANGAKLLSTSEKKSITGNTGRTKIIYFGAEGEIRDYSCTASTSKALIMKAITLFDLLADGRVESVSPGDYYLQTYYGKDNILSNFYAAVCCSYYSDVLRDMHILFEREKLVDMPAWVKIKDQFAASKKAGIRAMGDLKPLYVVGKDSKDDKDKELYKALLQAKMNPQEGAVFDKAKGFFVIADYDEDKHKRVFEAEKSLAENFVGKYWIRGASDGGSYTYDAGDGQVTYYSDGSEVSFPFLNLLPDSIKKSSDFLQNVITRPPGSSPLISKDRFIMLERTAIWSPAPKSKEIDDLLEYLTPVSISDLGPEDGGLGLVGDGQTIFAVYPKPAKLNIGKGAQRFRSGRNALDSKNTNKPGTLNGHTTTYGLQSASTSEMEVEWPGGYFLLQMPSQAGLKFGSDYGGFVVLANGSNVESTIKMVLPKKEMLLGDVANDSDKDVASEFVFKDATQSLVSFLESSGARSCRYKDESVLALLNQYNARQKMFPSVERISRTYELAGMPETLFNAADGLQDFSITVGDGGMKTTVTFANRPAEKPSEEIEERRFEKIAAALGKAKNYFRK